MNITHGGNVQALARRLGCGPEEILDFSASINPLGLAPGVREAMVGAMKDIVQYPEPQATRLNAALADAWQVPAELVMTGNGATDLIHFFARCAVPRPDPVTLLVPTFSEFHRAYPDATLVTQPAQLRGLAVVTRPNNPLGTMLPLEAIERLLRQGCFVLVDESFVEFTEAPSALELVERYERLLVLRSLTKLHALPGLRIGALVGQAVPALQPRREPWTVNTLAEAAALASLAATEHHRRTREWIAAERCWLSRQLTEIPGFTPAPSVANYLLVRVADDPRPLVEWLADRRVLVRDCSETPGVDEPAIRVAVRRRPDHERLLALFKEYPCASF